MHCLTSLSLVASISFFLISALLATADEDVKTFPRYSKIWRHNSFVKPSDFTLVSIPGRRCDYQLTFKRQNFDGLYDWFFLTTYVRNPYKFGQIPLYGRLPYSSSSRTNLRYGTRKSASPPDRYLLNSENRGGAVLSVHPFRGVCLRGEDGVEPQSFEARTVPDQSFEQRNDFTAGNLTVQRGGRPGASQQADVVVPGVPQNVKVRAIGQSYTKAFNVSWKPAAGATGYYVLGLQSDPYFEGGIRNTIETVRVSGGHRTWAVLESQFNEVVSVISEGEPGILCDVTLVPEVDIN